MKQRNLIFVAILILLNAAFGAPLIRAQNVAETNFVRQSDSARYFQLEDGTDFLPIGHNEGWADPGLRELVGDLTNFNVQAAREYFNKLHNHGVNVIRVWVDAPTISNQWDGLALEKPLGQWDSENIKSLDLLFELARDYSIYLLIMPYDTFWMNYGGNPPPRLGYFDPKAGGPIHNLNEWLTSPASIEYHKARWRFLIDRYGWSNRIFAWDVMNEIDGDGSFHPPTTAGIMDYAMKMSSYIQQYERQKWGKNHLVTASTVNSEPTGDIAFLAYQHPNIDFACNHMFYWPQMSSRTDVTTGALRVNRGVKYQLSHMLANNPRPFFTSEWWPTVDNGFWNPIKRDFEDEQCHNVSWAHLASGGAGNGMYLVSWRFFNEGYYDDELAMSRVAKNIRWSKFNSKNIDGQIGLIGGNIGSHTVARMGCSDSHTALVWLMQNVSKTTGTVSGTSVNVSGMTGGDYRCAFYDTRTGDLVRETIITASAGVVAAQVPDFDRDIALILTNMAFSTPLKGKPQGYITSPKAMQGTNASSINVSADCWDDVGIDSVNFYANYNDGASKAWRYIGAKNAPPYAIVWNTSAIPDQSVDITVDLFDKGGRSVAPARQIAGVQLERVSGDKSVPIASLEYPGVGDTITQLQSVTLRAGAWDLSSGVSKVQFWTGPMGGGGVLLGEVYQPPYQLTANLLAYDHTTRWFTVDVFDKAGNSVRPADNHLNVVVDSAAQDLTTATGHFLSPEPGTAITTASPSVTLSADCMDKESGVDHVLYWANYDGGWKQIGQSSSTPPYSFVWTPTMPANQMVSLKMDIHDKAGHVTSEVDHVGGLFYSVPKGDTWAPWCHIQWPDSDTTIGLPCKIRAIAGDTYSGVKRVTLKYFWNNQWRQIGSASAPPYEVNWDGSVLPTRAVVKIGVDVEDNAGNLVTTSDERVRVTIQRPSASNIWTEYVGP